MSRFLNQSLRTQKLFIATSSCKLSEVQEQHLQGGHLDCESFQGITPLKVAVNSGDAKVSDDLLLCLISLNLNDNFAWSCQEREANGN